MDQRVQILTNYLEDDPTDLFSRYALAMEYRKSGMIVECIDQLNVVLQYDENYLGAYYQLGQAYLLQSRIDEALNVFQRGLDKADSAGDTHTASELREAMVIMDLNTE